MRERDLGVDEHTLLCERCGYVIEGLQPDGACPECGTAIAQSLPDRRVGSPWQRRGRGNFTAARAWAATFVDVVRRPTTTMGLLRIGRDGNRSLLWINVLLAAGLMALCWVKELVSVDIRFGTTRNFPGEVALAAAMVMVFMLLPAIAAGLVILIWIEQRGVRFFGRRRGWRVTRAIAWTVCSHASCWWVVGAAAALAVMLVLPTAWVERLPGRVGAAVWASRDWVWIAPGLAMVFLFGLLPFETVVYFGVRRCRFANRPPG